MGSLETECLDCEASNFRIWNSKSRKCLCYEGYFDDSVP